MDPLPAMPFTASAAQVPLASYTNPASYQVPSPGQFMPPAPKETDEIFDEAVNELFLDDGAFDMGLTDFVQEWGNSPNGGIETDIQDDAQLGFLLEKLLED